MKLGALYTAAQYKVRCAVSVSGRFVLWGKDVLAVGDEWIPRVLLDVVAITDISSEIIAAEIQRVIGSDCTD